MRPTAQGGPHATPQEFSVGLPAAASDTDGPLVAAACVAVEPVCSVLLGVIFSASSALAAPAFGLPAAAAFFAVAGFAAVAFAAVAFAAAGRDDFAAVVGLDFAGFAAAVLAALDGFVAVAVVDAAGFVAARVAVGFAAAGFVRGLGFAAGFAREVVPGFGFAAGDAVLVDDLGARGSPAAGAPTVRGEPDVPRRVAVLVRLAAAGVAGVAGVVGAASVAW